MIDHGGFPSNPAIPMFLRYAGEGWAGQEDGREKEVGLERQTDKWRGRGGGGEREKERERERGERERQADRQTDRQTDR